MNVLFTEFINHCAHVTYHAAYLRKNDYTYDSRYWDMNIVFRMYLFITQNMIQYIGEETFSFI